MVEPDPNSGSEAGLDFSDIPAVDALRRHLDGAQPEPGAAQGRPPAETRELLVASHLPPFADWHDAPTQGPGAVAPWPDNGPNCGLLATLAPPYYQGQDGGSAWSPPVAPAFAYPPYLAGPPSSASSAAPAASRHAGARHGGEQGLRGAQRDPLKERPRLKGRTRSDLWCEVFLDQHMAEVHEFEVEKKLIGKGGCNTKGIYLATGSKILVCGQGAERGKVRRKRMTHDHLRIEIVSDRQAFSAFRKAFDMVLKLIIPIAADFDRFCMRNLHQKFDEPRYWIGSTTHGALTCLGALANDIEVAPDALELPLPERARSRPRNRRDEDGSEDLNAQALELDRHLGAPGVEEPGIERGRGRAKDITPTDLLQSFVPAEPARQPWDGGGALAAEVVRDAEAEGWQ